MLIFISEIETCDEKLITHLHNVRIKFKIANYFKCVQNKVYV